MPFVYESLEYLTATEAATELGVSRQTFYETVRPLLTVHHLGVRTRAYYKTSDIKQLKEAKATPPLPVIIHGIQKNFVDSMRAFGIPCIVEDLSKPDFVPMDKDLAEIFKVPVGSPIVRREQIQGTPGTPYRLVTNLYPAKYMSDDILEEFRKNVDANGPLLMKAAFGVIIEHLEETISSRTPSPTERKHLKIRVDTPVITVRRVNYDADMHAVMVSDLVLVSLYFRLKYTYSVDFWKEKTKPENKN